ncbi:Acyl-ACP thioesterase [Corchorus olitorius]|uniref:Acyl-[acyl-carrier-protein] hydrolase n=1 Tax=Corchorus olitorius TaxID=93759 RepID=A0A1R3H938_9ROSI|nr:Acyl-ACP thioesterase [Corchorus olitorius]
MAASSNIASTFFVLNSSSSLSSWNSSNNKSKICLQRSNRRSSSNKFNYPDLKIKLHDDAQPILLNGERRGLESMVESPKYKDMTSVLPESMEHLTLEGRLIRGGRFFENHIIRSSEIDPDNKVTTRAIMNFLQEASLNHMKKWGMSTNALFGVTPEMSKRDLLWVFRSMHIEVDCYPSWADVIQVCHWFCSSGRTGIRLDWIISNLKTGETLVRASCLAVLMNKKTRKTCKLPEEVKEELKHFVHTNAEPIVAVERNLYPEIETMNHIRDGLTPGWHDLDCNYHVNNAKYLDWILESIPGSIIYSHELSKIKLEYRKECLKDDVIQSLSKVVTNEIDQGIELEHVLRLESGPEVVRARTAWRPKSICQT